MARVFSGIQPSGELHIGNYLGAVQNWVKLQHQHDCLFSVVDLHAITQPYEVSSLAQRTSEMAIGLLAAGLDPERAIVFVQSHVREHTELNWLLNAHGVTPLGELERQTQFKDKAQRQESVSAGLLNYPVLQAADVLLYQAALVPVGEDQLQHLELMREIARRWNARFANGGGFSFPEPQALLSTAKRVLGLDGQAKMSKSLGNTIGLFDTPETIWEKLKPAATDPARVTRKDPGNPDSRLGVPRLQARARGQYDSHAHPPPRARPRVAGAAGDSERDPAGGRGEGAGARPRHDGAGAAVHGFARGSGGLMQHFIEQMIQMFRLELFLQLSLATLFGGAIGLERELGGKPAGLRTNILICIGSVLYTKLSVTMASGNSDPTRVAAQIVTGVGFIGAGTILHARGAVVGLTSAATIWVVAAIGVALGAAFYWEAAGTTLLVLLVLQGLGRVELVVERQSTQSSLSVHARPDPTALEDLETVVRRTGLAIERQASRRENIDLVIDFTLRGPKRLHDQVMIALLHHPSVRTVSTGE